MVQTNDPLGPREGPVGITPGSSTSNDPVTEEADLINGRGRLEEGRSLCLSGGGYRAMLFHVGAILRLNELGILSGLKRIASVSGGSITAAVLGCHWNQLELQGEHFTPESLQSLLVEPIQKMASTSIDVSSVIWGTLSPWNSINDQVIAAYDQVLFQGQTLQDLPDDSKGPRIILVATNVKTGSLWRFSQPYMADYRIGKVLLPRVSLAEAVAASSAFPPFLSPMRLPLDGFAFENDIPHGIPEANMRSLRGEAILTDGGVYDNLGLEAVWKRYKTVLISDGGRKMNDDISPSTDWPRHSRRLIDLLQHQVSNLRRRQAISAFRSEVDAHEGAYWGAQTNITDYGLEQTLPCPHGKTTRISEIPTRLTSLSPQDQKRIMNWGYAVCDAAVRRYLSGFEEAEVPRRFPFHDIGLG